MDRPWAEADNEVSHEHSVTPENQPASFVPMKFIVRYWSSLLPRDYRERRGEHRWLDYSVHPASKLGLHNAMLAVHDRSEILQAHGCQFECAVFVVEEEHVDRLSPEKADILFSSLPRGDVKWLDIREFLLPVSPPAIQSGVLQGISRPAQPLPEQLPLFAHVHTPYDDLEQTFHAIDIDT
jgi:hypothetical protein